MPDGTPTQKDIRDYCRAALAKGFLTEEEHAQIDEWLPMHPDYEPHWELCYHGKPNQQGTYGLCVFGDGTHWPTSYYNFKAKSETVARNRLETAGRRAIRPSRDRFLVDHPDGWEADHANPGGFKTILDAFVCCRGTPVVEYSQELGGWSLDPDTAATFREYHDERVEWQALSPEEHRRVTTERRRVPK